MYKKFTSVCQVLKETHTEENWFFFLPYGVYETNAESGLYVGVVCSLAMVKFAKLLTALAQAGISLH